MKGMGGVEEEDMGEEMRGVYEGIMEEVGGGEVEVEGGLEMEICEVD